MKPTKEQIIEWVRAVADSGKVDPVSTGGLFVTLTPEELQRFTNIVYAKGQEDMWVAEPVAVVDANDDGYWAEILPDRSVKVGQLLYTQSPALPILKGGKG